jgi:hypothetical protein
MTRTSGQFYPFPVFFVILMLCLITYTFLHEAGHTIIAFLGGADIREFTLLRLPPHETFGNQIGGVYAHLVSLAGPMFPVIVALIFMLLVPKTKNIVLETSKTIFTGLTIFALFGSIISLFLFIAGKNSDADTIGFFAQNPGVNPMLAALTCLFLITVLFALIGIKANYLVIPGLYDLLQKDSSTITNRKKKVVLSLIVLLSLGLAAACLFNPEKPQVLLRADLSTFTAGEVELYRFCIQQDSLIYEYTIQKLKATEFELSVRTDTSRSILFSGKGIAADIYQRRFVLHRGIHLLFAHNINGNGIFTLKQVAN